VLCFSPVRLQNATSRRNSNQITGIRELSSFSVFSLNLKVTIINFSHQQPSSNMASNAAPSDPPSPWRNSQAKHLLKEDIVKGLVYSSMPAKEVYQMRPEWYKRYKFNNFKTNLDSLHKRITKDKDRADEDLAAFLHDMAILPHPTNAAAAAYPRWQDSEAEQLLKSDIEAGVGTTSLKPQQLWESRIEYQAYPLNVFRKHIHQEMRAETEKGYWLNKKKEKEEKKKKKKKQQK
jgi:hypothetical protein